MATVYRAVRRSDGVPVAIKVLDPRLHQILGDNRFQREIDILSRLDHPAILPLLGYGNANGFLYYVMPFVAGPTLRQRIDRELYRQLPLDEAISIASTVLEALEYAHGKNVIHRDIKPENVLLDDGRARVGDFGIARAILRSGGDRASSTGFVIGTPAYMSPEQASGETQLDGRSDVYSVGCLLYEMLVGEPPFSGPTAQAVQARHKHDPPPSLRVVRPGVPEGLQAVIEKALAKAPADRFLSAAAFRAALSRGLTVGAHEGHDWRRAIAAAAVLVVVLGTVVMLRPPTAQHTDDRYLVLPCRVEALVTVATLDGANCTRLVWQGLSRWRDLELVDDPVAEDWVRQAEGTVESLSEGLALGRRHGVGRVVWSEVYQVGDSVVVSASVYRTVSSAPSAEYRSRVALPASDAGLSARAIVDRLHQLARGLVASTLAESDEPVSIGATESVSALRARLAGDNALVAWDLLAALRHYADAFAADPGYAAARLRYAHTALWADRPVDEWRPAAEAALTTADGLRGVERREAEALVALATNDFPKACSGFRALIEQDSARFSGWFGLGECLTRDNVVVPDRGSPSGWSFRSSHFAGVEYPDG